MELTNGAQAELTPEIVENLLNQHFKPFAPPTRQRRKTKAETFNQRPPKPILREKKSCVVCASPIPAGPNYAARKFCSKRCKNRKEYLQRKAKSPSPADSKRCEFCGSAIVGKRADHKQTKFCSDRCRRDAEIKKYAPILKAARDKAREEALLNAPERDCVICGDPLPPERALDYRAKYCSKRCNTTAGNNKRRRRNLEKEGNSTNPVGNDEQGVAVVQDGEESYGHEKPGEPQITFAGLVGISKALQDIGVNVALEATVEPATHAILEELSELGEEVERLLDLQENFQQVLTAEDGRRIEMRPKLDGYFAAMQRRVVLLARKANEQLEKENK